MVSLKQFPTLYINEISIVIRAFRAYSLSYDDSNQIHIYSHFNSIIEGPQFYPESITSREGFSNLSSLY